MIPELPEACVSWVTKGSVSSPGSFADCSPCAGLGYRRLWVSVCPKQLSFPATQPEAHPHHAARCPPLLWGHFSRLCSATLLKPYFTWHSVA